MIDVLLQDTLDVTVDFPSDFDVTMESTDIMLKELHIDKNGTYVPTDSDGFNKVVANIIPKSAPLKVTQNMVSYSPQDVGADAISKVDVEIRNVGKLPAINFLVSDEMLDEDGRWLLDSLVDTSLMTTMVNLFTNARNLTAIDTSTWDTSNVTNIGNMFPGSKIKFIDVSNWDTSKFTNMNRAFVSCALLEHIDVSNWDVSSVTTMSGMFQGCDALKVLDLRNWDVSNCTNLSSAFDCKNLESLVGGATIEEVLEQNMCALKGMRVNCLLKTNNLDRASFRAVINGLADLTGQASRTISLSKYHKDRFTQEDIDLATSKNWTLAWG